jgi:DNA-binding NarL/FixJ family response regulator
MAAMTAASAAVRPVDEAPASTASAPALFVAPEPVASPAEREVRILARAREQITAFLARAADGPGRCLVVLGSAGSGKTTLVEEAIAQLDLVDVVRLEGLASERELPLAGLHQLCGRLAVHVDRLPAPQRDALEVALGRRPGEIDRFLVAVAVLGLLTRAAGERPVVCFVDDADCLDDPTLEALAFIAHRLSAARVSLLFTVRTRVAQLHGLDELALHSLPPDEARAFVTAAYPGRLPAWTRARIVAEARGNPAALLALGAEVAADDGAGGFSRASSAGETIDHDPGQCGLDRLDAEMRRVLLVAAAQVDGDPVRFWDALQGLGIDGQVAHEAATRGLLEFGTCITFPDLQLRGIVYRAAPASSLRQVHQALADVCDASSERSLRAWHLGQTTLAPDDSIADALEDAVQDARTQAGRIGAAALLARATMLTRDPARRARRALAAAHLAHEGGAIDTAGRLLELADGSVLDERDCARSVHLRSELAWATGDPGAVAAMLESAGALSSIDPQLGADAHVAALEATLRAGALGPAGAPRTAGEAMPRSAPTELDAADLLGAGLATLEANGFGAAAPRLRRAVEASRWSDDPHVCAVASRVAEMTWDVEAAHDLLAARIDTARERGALRDLTDVLDELGALHAHAGDLQCATCVVEAATAFGARAATAPPVLAAMVVAAWRGQEERAAELIETSRHLAVERGRGELLAGADYAGAVLANGLGRYETVLAGLPNDRTGDGPWASWLLPELIEAAARAGESVLARTLVDRLLVRTHDSPTAWARGVEARARALVADHSVAEQLHQDAIRHLGATRLVAQRARAHLLYGEWLRRCRRRLDARAQLRIAHDLFASFGADAFATRASRELRATGERARRRTVDTAVDLTPREEEIANLARDGESNPQIAGRLFISTRTVEYHLHKVFTKLGISSRAQLAWSLDPAAR